MLDRDNFELLNAALEFWRLAAVHTLHREELYRALRLVSEMGAKWHGSQQDVIQFMYAMLGMDCMVSVGVMTYLRNCG